MIAYGSSKGAVVMAFPSPSSILASKKNRLPWPGSLETERVPPHRSDQLARDREPEAGAAVPARIARIDLIEGLEQSLLLRAGNAGAGVLDREMQYHLAVGGLTRLLDRQRHQPLLGELEPVADQIEQYLAELASIAHDKVGHVAGNPGLEPESLLGRAEAHQRLDVLDQLTQIEIPRLQQDLTRLDLRVVEDVVEDAEQRLAL